MNQMYNICIKFPIKCQLTDLMFSSAAIFKLQWHHMTYTHQYLFAESTSIGHWPVLFLSIYQLFHLCQV